MRPHPNLICPCCKSKFVKDNTDFEVKCLECGMTMTHPNAGEARTLWARAAFSTLPAWPHNVPGLGRVTNEDDGVLTLQFKTDDDSQAFMHNYEPSVDVRDMPPNR